MMDKETKEMHRQKRAADVFNNAYALGMANAHDHQQARKQAAAAVVAFFASLELAL